MTGKKLSPTMRKVLAKLAKEPSNAYRLRCSISTLMALAERRLIWVEATLGSIAFPRQARATITDAGRAELSAKR